MMTIGGYKNGSEDFISLKEVSITCTTIDDIDNIISFLQHVKEQHSAVKDKTSTCHSHYRDWFEGWQKNEPDFVVISIFEDCK